MAPARAGPTRNTGLARNAGPARSARLTRNAVGSLAVTGVIVLVALVLPLVDRGLPATRPVAAGSRYLVGGGVSVIPPPGAEVDLSRTRPGPQRGAALFRVGGIRVAVVVGPFRGSLPDAAQRLRNKIINNGGSHLTGPVRVAMTAQSVPGASGDYWSPGRFGEYVVFVEHDHAVELTASGPQDQRNSLSAALEVSLSSLDFGDR
jgi:hypothetical protein